MNEETLTIELQAILMDAQDKFDPAAFKRLLAMAARDLARLAPRVRRGSVTLVAGTAAYTAPPDMRSALMDLWGKDQISSGTLKPWEANWPGRLPRMTLEDGTLYLTPAPTAQQISVLGSDYPFRYSAFYTLASTDAETNIPERLHDALLVRAAAQAMQELAHRNVTKPVALGGKGNSLSMPTNGTPSALARALMALFERMAA